VLIILFEDHRVVLKSLLGEKKFYELKVSLLLPGYSIIPELFLFREIPQNDLPTIFSVVYSNFYLITAA